MMTLNTRKQLLESYLDAELGAVLSTDDRITDTTQVLGADRCLASLKKNFEDRVPVVVNDQDFAPALLNLRQQVQHQAGPVVDIRGFKPALLAICQQIHRQARGFVQRYQRDQTRMVIRKWLLHRKIGHSKITITIRTWSNNTPAFYTCYIENKGVAFS